MAERTLRAGVVGLGLMGRFHCRALNDLAGVEFIGAFDPDLGSPSEMYSAPVVRTLDELLALGVDYCVVAAPTAHHLELGLALAEAGVHALIEKPLALDVDESRRLTDAFAAAGLIGGVGHIERYNAAIIEMRERIARGELGTVFQVSTRRQGPFPGRIGDVGVVKDLATHDIDLTAWVTGQGYADVSSRLTHRVGRPFEDMMVAIGRLDGGTIVSHTVNWLTPFKERTVVAHGERGALVADTLTADLTFHANGTVASEWDGVARFRGVSEGDVTRFAFPRREPLMVEHEAFRDAVLSGDTSGIVDLEQGTRVVDVATRIIDADPSRSS